MRVVVAVLLLACGSSSTTNSIEVRLDAPSGVVTVRDVIVTFSSSAGVAFECILDGVSEACASPKTFAGLQDGAHSLVVVGTQGRLRHEASGAWTVDATPPVVTITSAPPAASVDATDIQLAFTCSEQCTFSCALDGAVAAPCASPIDYAVAAGSHTFVVTAVDAGGLQGSASHSWALTLTPAPLITDAHFTADSLILVTMGSAAHPESTFALSPARPKAMRVTETTWISTTQAVLHWATSATPGTYSLTLTAPNGLTSEQQVGNNLTRVMFITRAKGTGDLSSWPLAGTGATGLAAGDRICQKSAMNAGLGGNYRALLSTDATDAYCHVFGGSGKLPCSGIDTSIGPWRRTDGTPVANTADFSLFSRLQLAPVRFDEAQVAIEDDAFAFTGSDSDGTVYGANSTCGGWSSAVGASDGHGLQALVHDTLFNYVGQGCQRDGHLICVQSDGDGFAFGDEIVLTGKRAFITEAYGNGNLATWPTAGGATGLAAADAACADAADNEGISGNFVAWMSDASSDAYCRLAGFTGKKANNCGQAALPSKQGPWLRSDGWLIAQSLSDLTDGTIGAPLSFQLDGTHFPLNTILTGTTASGEASPDTCNDWTSASSGAHGEAGTGYSDGDDWTSNGYATCDQPTSLIFCFER